MTDAITDADIKIFLRVLFKRPTKGLEENGDSWSLGPASVRISKRHPLFTDGFYSNLRPESHFYKRWFDFPDTGARGWAIIFQVFPPIDPPKQVSEYMAGWVPPEREAEADGWIAILNSEIHARLIAAGIQPHPPAAAAAPMGTPPATVGTTATSTGAPATNADAPDPVPPPSTIADDRHIRYVLSVGPQAVIEGLRETEDAVSLGGPLWISKFHPLYKIGSAANPSGDIRRLQPESHFCKRWFAFADTGERGWIIYFKPTATYTSVCGWVPPEREAEAEGWITTLNANIHARLAATLQPGGDAGGGAPTTSPTAVDPWTNATVQRLRSLGLIVPDASNMDDLVTQLKQWSEADTPIDARSKDPKSST